MSESSSDGAGRSGDRTAERRRMVERQLVPRGITHPAVLRAVLDVPREVFVDEQYRDQAYADCPLPIAGGQTISQPFTVAFMCQQIADAPRKHVLEVGTGSGYAAAVLSRLADRVDTIERIPELAELARERLARLGIDNVTVHVGDGSRGLPECAPFDAIVSAAAAESVPECWFDQLAVGGRIVVPVGGPDDIQQMMVYRKLSDGITSDSLGAFRFVPLIASGPAENDHRDDRNGASADDLSH